MQADTGDQSQYDVLVQPQIIPTIRSMARGNDTHTHTYTDTTRQSRSTRQVPWNNAGTVQS